MSRQKIVETPLLFLVPATALVAFPFFSDFSTPKLLLAGLVCAFLLVTGRSGLRTTRLGNHPIISGFRTTRLGNHPIISGFRTTRLTPWCFGGYLAMSVPAYIQAPGWALARQALTLDLISLVVLLCAFRMSSGLRSRLPVWLMTAAVGVLAFCALEWAAPAVMAVLGALPGSSTLGNPDFVAEYLACLSPVAAWFLWQRGLLARVAGGLVLAGTGVVLATHDSVTAVFALVAAGSVMVARIVLRLLAHRTRLRPLVLGLVAVIGIGGFVVATQSMGSGRLYLYEISQQAMREKPVAGHGTGSFGAVFMRHQGEFLQDNKEPRPFWTNARHAHNQLLHIGVERGLPAVLLLLMIWIMGVGKVKAGGFVLPVYIAMLVCFSGSVTYDQVPFRVLFFVLLGIGAAGNREVKDNHPTPGANPALNTNPTPGANPALSVVAGMLGLLLVVMPLWHAIGDVLFVRGNIEQAYRIDSTNSRLQYALGQVRLIEGKNDEAAVLLESSLAGHANLTTWLSLGTAHYRAARMEDAEQAFLTAIGWKPDFAAAFANLALLYHETGRPELAQRYLQRALSLRPGDPQIARFKEIIR